MAVVTKVGTEHTKMGYIEYKMSEEGARELLKQANFKDGPSSRRGQAYLCKLINDTYGLKGECTKVLFV